MFQHPRSSVEDDSRNWAVCMLLGEFVSTRGRDDTHNRIFFDLVLASQMKEKHWSTSPETRV